MTENYILKGAPMGYIPDISFAEYVLPKMKSIPKDKIVLIDAGSGKTRTNWEFLTNGIRLLEGLKKLGLEENDVIGLLCRNSFEANDVLLAGWLGAAPVAPINGAMKVAELKHIFGLVKPKFIFYEEDIRDNVLSALDGFPFSSTLIVVGRGKNSVDKHLAFEDVLVEDDVDVENFKPNPIKSPSTQLLVIPPSSGTSGMPKAVGITHRNLIFQDIGCDTSITLGDVNIAWQNSHFFWVTGIILFLRTVTVGLTRVFNQDITNENILKAIEKYKVETSIFGPLSLLALVQSPDFHKYDLSSMKKAFVGGSPLTESIFKKIKEACPHLALIQGYGLTEATGIVTENLEEDMSIGRVFYGIQAKVIDPQTGEALKANSLGEICVKSIGLMLGYVGNEEQTKEAIDEQGWLHTGDIGYYDESQKFYIVDRLKEIVKIRNMQVSPVEIENVILNIPGVKEVGVIGIPHEEDHHQLMAFVVVEDRSKVTEDDIHSCVESTLSDYKQLKGGIRFVDFIPKTASGKIQRKQLQLLVNN